MKNKLSEKKELDVKDLILNDPEARIRIAIKNAQERVDKCSQIKINYSSYGMSGRYVCQ